MLPITEDNTKQAKGELSFLATKIAAATTYYFLVSRVKVN